MAIGKGSTTTVALGSRTNTVVTKPAGVSAGHVLTVSMKVGVASLTSITVTPPAGWATVGPIVYGDTDPWRTTQYKFLRVLDGSEGASFTFTHTAAASEAFCQTWTGVDPTTPQDVAASTVTSGTPGAASANIDVPSLTTVTAGAQLVLARGSWDGNAISPPTAPSTWTEDLDAPELWVGDLNIAVAGATGTVTVARGNNSNNSPAAAIMVALRPAGAAAAASDLILPTRRLLPILTR